MHMLMLMHLHMCTCMWLQVRMTLGDKVPVLMVSAAAQMGAVHTCLQRGADLCAAAPSSIVPPSLRPR